MTLTSPIVKFAGRMVMVGFGSIGQGVLPLLLRHIDMKPEQITIVTAEERGQAEAAEYGIKFIASPLTRENFRDRARPPGRRRRLPAEPVGRCVVSLALIKFCHERGALYLDTCIEPWAGGYTDTSLSPSLRSNYALREAALQHKGGYANGPTAVITHGANPGLVSHFVKQALLDIARDTGRRGADSAQPERLGGTGADARDQGDPHRRARHPGRQRAQEARRVRQYLVDRRLRRRRLPAGRAWLGHP